MVVHVPRLAAALLALCAVFQLPGAPARAAEAPAFEACAKPEWPRASRRFGQQGKVTLAFLIGEDGAVRESKVVRSSGFPLLDEAARAGLAQCRFKPARKDGEPVAAWQKMQYVWTLQPDGETEHDKAYAAAAPQQKAAVLGAAGRGVPQAEEIVTRAALRGDAAAQAWLGRRYESGNGVPADRAAAAHWYGKAAAGGDEAARAALARLSEGAAAQ